MGLREGGTQQASLPPRFSSYDSLLVFRRHSLHRLGHCYPTETPSHTYAHNSVSGETIGGSDAGAAGTDCVGFFFCVFCDWQLHAKCAGRAITHRGVGKSLITEGNKCDEKNVISVSRLCRGFSIHESVAADTKTIVFP